MIDINNLTKILIDKKFLTGVAKIVLKGENIRTSSRTLISSKIRTSISIALIKESEIKKINQKYRKKNKVTDVLSFDFGKGFGEIVICPSQVKRNAKKYRTSFKKELAKVLIHGILHILGYNHGKSKKEAIEMEKKEERYLSQFF